MNHLIDEETDGYNDDRDDSYEPWHNEDRSDDWDADEDHGSMCDDCMDVGSCMGRDDCPAGW